MAETEGGTEDDAAKGNAGCFGGFARDILAGRYEGGSLLPREPDLCAQFGVSRTVIREVLKVLAAKGMVITRPRVGTMVCDREH